ncbi:MAG: long-chain fatty acid--CoA ligase [Verrucomicrobia bacterium]|nr:long-chain fatty acid--CoA ligase [Verrucomicrobiota bacterium]
MKTARKTIYQSAPKSPPAGELDACIFDFIARGVERHSTDAEFGSLALALFRHQFALNRPYRRYCELLGRSPRNVKHWKQIPAVPTTAFKDAELTTLPPRQRTAVFHSSGTTEHRPSRHFHSAATLALYEAALWPMFASRMLELEPVAAVTDRRYSNCRLIILTPTPAEAPHSSLVHMMETVRRRFGAPHSAFVGATALEDGRALAAAVHSALRTSHSAFLLGTAFAFVRLLDAMATSRRGRGLQLPPGSRVMETGGYKGRTREVPREELHALISAKLGVPRSAIISEYGMCELSSQFYTGGEVRSPGFSRQSQSRVMAAWEPAEAGTPNLARDAAGSAVFRGPPWTRVQVINPETDREAGDGERGFIRIFDLANRASVSAIQTEDIGIRRGDGFELIGRAPQAEARGCSLMVPS